MPRDPHIRDYSQPGPYVPGTLSRFRWPERSDTEPQMLRERVQEEGRGLYILRAPYDGEKMLVEAYWPDEVQPHYARDSLDPFRFDDYSQGRLVVVRVFDDIKSPREPLNQAHIAELRRNNRAARADLKRQSCALYRSQEIQNRQDAEDEEAFDRWVDFYLDAREQTRKYVLTPHVGPARNNAIGGDIRNHW